MAFFGFFWIDFTDSSKTLNTVGDYLQYFLKMFSSIYILYPN